MFFKSKLKRNAKKNILSNSYLDKKVSSWKPLSIMIPGIIIIILFMIIPLLSTISRSFFVLENPDKAGSNRVFGFENFNILFEHEAFKGGVINTILYALISLPISIGLSLLISSLIVSIINKYVKSFFQTVFFLPYVTSVVAVGLAFLAIFQSTNLLNSILGTNYQFLNGGTNSNMSIISIIIYGVWSSLAFQVLIFSTAMLSIDKNRYKAASIDGASPFVQFVRITLPSIRSTLAFIVTIGLINSIKVNPSVLWGNNPNEAIANNGSTLLLFIYNATINGSYDLAATASIMLLIISIGLTLILKNSIKLFSYTYTKGVSWNVERKIKNSAMIL